MENIITLLSGVVTLLATGLGALALKQISDMHQSQQTDSRDQWKAIAEINKTVGDVREQAAKDRGAQETALAMHRAQVAEQYPSRQALLDLLAPIMDELKKIDRKLDAKMDKEDFRG